MTATTRRDFLKTAAALGALSAWDCWLPCSAASAAPAFTFAPSREIIPAPDDPAQWPAFREALAKWREETKAGLKYSDALYARPEFAWSASNYSCCFLMMCDETFYDSRSGRYTVDAFLDHGQREFGGYDSVVLWHAYPRIGVDERNQFDFYRDMPGRPERRARGRRAVPAPRRAGVHRLQSLGHAARAARRSRTSTCWSRWCRRCEVDGIFLDTMSKGAAEFRAKLDAARPGVILEGEGALPLENLHDHHASWAQWFDDSEVPGVLRHKWLERRHMQHQIQRWELRPHRRTARRLDERQRHDGLGERVRLLGAVEPSATARSSAPCCRSSGDSPGSSPAKAGRRWCRPNNRASMPRSGKATACGSGRSSTAATKTVRGPVAEVPSEPATVTST